MFLCNSCLFQNELICLPEVQLIFPIFFSVKYLFPCTLRKIFLKLLCQKRLFGACPFRRIVRYIRAYPGRAASWALPFKYLKYHLKSLVRHG